MGFVKGRTGKGAVLLAMIAGLLGALPAAAGAQSKAKIPLPTPAVESGPSNVELVNKALNPGASNPDIPLPHPDLTAAGAGRSSRSTGTQIFGRQEEGGGVFGLRVPIPAGGNPSAATTRYSSGKSPSEAGQEMR